MRAYIIKYPDGQLNPTTITDIKKKITLSDKADCITDFEGLTEKGWKNLQSEGYRCVQVEIKELASSHKLPTP